MKSAGSDAGRLFVYNIVYKTTRFRTTSYCSLKEMQKGVTIEDKLRNSLRSSIFFINKSF